MFNRFSAEPFSRADGSRGRFEDFVLEANAYLDSLKEKFPNLQLIDIDQIHAFNGRENTIDTRYIYNTSSIYTFKFYKHYSAMVSLALSKHYGDVKKVLVLDCDNTLWGGIIGEDGPSRRVCRYLQTSYWGYSMKYKPFTKQWAKMVP